MKILIHLEISGFASRGALERFASYHSNVIVPLRGDANLRDLETFKDRATGR